MPRAGPWAPKESESRTNRSVDVPRVVVSLVLALSTMDGPPRPRRLPRSSRPRPASKPRTRPAPSSPRGRAAVRSTRSGRGASTSATAPRITRPTTTSRRHQGTASDRGALWRGQQGRHGLHEGLVPEQRRRHGDSRLPVPAAEEARPGRPCRDGLGARRRARQLGHQHVPVREGSGRARLRRDLSRVPREHRLRREAPQGHRLRRLRDRRHDERGGVPEVAAARRSGAARR